MNLLFLFALAVPLSCLALLGSLAFLGVLTLGLVIQAARRRQWLSSSRPF
jgi:hypothetical protein